MDGCAAARARTRLRCRRADDCIWLHSLDGGRKKRMYTNATRREAWMHAGLARSVGPTGACTGRVREYVLFGSVLLMDMA